MRIREATLADRLAWDSFVDSEGGSFFHYFDWKHVDEAGGGQFIPLMAETDESHLVGILPVVKKKTLPYSTLTSLPHGASGGHLLKRGLSDEEVYEASSALLQYVDKHLSARCSTFTFRENLPLDSEPNQEPTVVLIDNGFRFRLDRSTRLPCTHVLELRQPFEDNVWKGWSRTLKKHISRAEKDGVVVVLDREFNYADDFIDMLYENYRRHRTRPPTRDEIKVRLDVFRDRSALFVALSAGQPIVALLCYYTPSTCHLAMVGSYEKDTDNANKLCYKVAIEDACDRGYRFVEFGISLTASLAFLKERFRADRVPMRVYEKRCSAPRYLIEKAYDLASNSWHDKGYIWRSRRIIRDRIVHM
jgi:hypothetical protein